MLAQKDTYTVGELFDNLTITYTDLAKASETTLQTLARIRKGESVYRSTVNRLLNAFSTVYGRPFTLENVTGLNVMRNTRLENKGMRPVGRPRKSA